MKYFLDYFLNPKNHVTIFLGFIIIVFIVASLRYYFFSSHEANGNPGFNGISLRLGRLNVTHYNLGNHAAIYGASSAGKTTNFIIPFIKQLIKDDLPGFLYDFKSKTLANIIYHQSTKFRGKTKNFFVSIEDPRYSHRVNPLSQIESASECVELATTLLSNLNKGQQQNNFWTKSAIALLSSTIYFLSRYEGGRYSTLPHVIELILSPDPKKLLTLLSSDEGSLTLLSPIYAAQGSEETLASQLATIKADLAMYGLDENLYWVLSANSPGCDSFALNDKAHPTRLILGATPSQPEYSTPIMAFLMSACLRKMVADDRHKSMCIMDEAGTYTLAGLAQTISTCRSYGIGLQFALQSFSQLEQRYGHHDATTIESNCNTKGWGRITVQKELATIQSLFGKVDIKKKSYSTNRQGANISSGQNTSPDQEYRVRESLLPEFAPGEFIFISNGKKFKQRVPLKKEEKITPLPELTYVTPQMIKDNFLKIKSEIKTLLK
jgi:type IV secretory pathway TraG/TraD family ATPase VirD4